ncbi:MAG: phage virion morphogenesis protein [Prevotellaceae bacterium]|jgi:phage gpG-like protein|nr:phage virion morphogenesis protein [Prevotellaceae bacterium]
MQDFIKKIRKIQNFLNDRVFEVVGNEAVSHYEKSFRDEGFTDSATVKWKNVKRREKPRKTKRKEGSRPLAWDRAKILTQSGELGDSIKFARGSDRSVIISSDKEYAVYHNKGVKAARGKRGLPKRQFIGKSDELNKKISEKIKQHINKLTQ